MLGSVQFYHQSGFVTIEIRNKIANDILPAKTQGISAQKTIPQQAFLPGLILTKRLRVFFRF